MFPIAGLTKDGSIKKDERINEKKNERMNEKEGWISEWKGAMNKWKESKI